MAFLLFACWWAVKKYTLTYHICRFAVAEPEFAIGAKVVVLFASPGYALGPIYKSLCFMTLGLSLAWVVPSQKNLCVTFTRLTINFIGYNWLFVVIGMPITATLLDYNVVLNNATAISSKNVFLVESRNFNIRI